MDDGGQRDNGRHKSVHAQWMMPQHQMKDNYTMRLMTIIAERDAAIQQRNLYVAEKKAALAERDKAYLQRDAVMAEWNSAVLERDEFLAALARETSSINNGGGSGSTFPAGSTANRGTKHVYNHHQQHHHNQQQPHVPSAQSSPAQLSDAQYEQTREMQINEAFPDNSAPESVSKPRRQKRSRKDARAGEAPINKPPKASKRSNKNVGQDMRQATVTKKHEWKGQDLGLNQVAYDDSTMPAPGCTCTGVFHQCYKWGNGGWQSSCCTTTLSMHPLPVMPNKRHARVGGRKMSGSAFNKLLSRLAAEGHDLSAPIDLKDHWAKHGTNRYITIR